MDTRQAVQILKIAGLYTDETVQEAIQHLAGLSTLETRLDCLEKCVLALLQMQENMGLYHIPGPWDEFRKELKK